MRHPHGQRLVAPFALQHADGGAVHEDLRAVAHPALEVQQPVPRGGKGGAVQHMAAVHAEFVHRDGVLRAHDPLQRPGVRQQRRPVVQVDGDRRELGLGAGAAVGDRRVPGDDLAEGVVLGAGVAALGERGVVVVRRDGGRVGVVVVGAVGEAEVGAAVEHVDVDRRARGQQPVQVRRGLLGGAHMVRAAPVVEPADPELRAHQRALALMRAQRGQVLVDSAAEGAGAERAGQAAGGQVRGVGLVAGEQQLVDTSGTQCLLDVLEVRGVVAVGAVLVLHL
ncbi:hypothetical protein SALBM311S_08453 [Streptomyces alboniger]